MWADRTQLLANSCVSVNVSVLKHFCYVFTFSSCLILIWKSLHICMVCRKQTNHWEHSDRIESTISYIVNSIARAMHRHINGLDLWLSNITLLYVRRSAMDWTEKQSYCRCDRDFYWIYEHANTTKTQLLLTTVWTGDTIPNCTSLDCWNVCRTGRGVSAPRLEPMVSRTDAVLCGRRKIERKAHITDRKPRTAVAEGR